jgi:hypothetical protein
MTPSYVFRTLLVAAQDVALASTIADTLGPGGSQGMFQTPLGPTADAPATWGASSGYIDPAWALLAPCGTWEQDEDGQWVRIAYYPGNPEAVVAACEEAGLVVSLADVQGIFDRSDVSEQDPWTAFARLGVTIVQPEESLA